MADITSGFTQVFVGVLVAALAIVVAALLRTPRPQPMLLRAGYGSRFGEPAACRDCLVVEAANQGLATSHLVDVVVESADGRMVQLEAVGALPGFPIALRPGEAVRVHVARETLTGALSVGPDTTDPGPPHPTLPPPGFTLLVQTQTDGVRADLPVVVEGAPVGRDEALSRHPEADTVEAWGTLSHAAQDESFPVVWHPRGTRPISAARPAPQRRPRRGRPREWRRRWDWRRLVRR